MRVLFRKHGGEDLLAVQTAHELTVICTQLFEGEVMISRFQKKFSAHIFIHSNLYLSFRVTLVMMVGQAMPVPL